MNLGGSLTRQAESDHNVSDASPHIANIGQMVEVCLSINLGWFTQAYSVTCNNCNIVTSVHGICRRV